MTTFLPNILAASDPITQALSGLAAALRVPVSIAMMIVLCLLALECGRLLIEGWRRIRPGSRNLEEVATQAMNDPADAATIARSSPGPLAERAVEDLSAAAQTTRKDAIENALASFELRVQRRLDRTRMLVRAGPALGLMGTLIPLAPGLTALGNGDFVPLAADLKVAFAATVIGIMVGTGAFALTLTRTRLYTEDLAALERAVIDRNPQTPAHNRVTAAVGEHAT